MASEAERPDPGIEQNKLRRLSSRTGGRVCTRCAKPALVRQRRPLFLRLLRLFGFDMRTYECAMCGHTAFLRQAQGEALAEHADRRLRVTLRGRYRRRSLLPLVVVLMGLAAGALLAAFQLLPARSHLDAGSRDLQAAAALIRPASSLRNPATPDAMRTDLSHGLRELKDARSELAPWSPLLAHLGWVPRVGGELAGAPPAADSAFYATMSALHLVDGIRPAWRALASPGAQRSFPALAPLLAEGHPDFLSGAADARHAIAALHALPQRTGNARLDAAGARLRSLLPSLRSGNIWLAAMPAFLGMNGASRYLVLLQDPTELRATGGFIGAADLITLRDGSIQTMASGSVLPREIGSVPAPLPEALYTPEGPWIFRDSNWSPDFPLSARLARWFYGEDTGRWADGVVGVVDTAVGPILSATGPVYLPEYRQWVTSANVASLAQRYVNGSYHGPVQNGSLQGTVRKQFMGYVVAAILRRVQSLPIARWPSLAHALSQVGAQRDLMLYDRRPSVDSAAVQAGVSGAMRPVPGDYLAIVDDNRSYNKINPYVTEAANYSAVVHGDLSLDAILTIRYHVNPSPSNLEGGGPGLGMWGTKHDYQDFLRVYVPPGARLTRMTGLDVWAPESAYGFTQLAGRLLVRAGQTRTVTITYSVPGSSFRGLPGSVYRLTVRHQPGATLPAVHVTVRACPSRRARS